MVLPESSCSWVLMNSVGNTCRLQMLLPPVKPPAITDLKRLLVDGVSFWVSASLVHGAP